MKNKLCLAIFAIVLLVGLPASGGASAVVDTVGWITGIQAVDIPFTVDTAPQTYVATITDLSWTDYTGFDLLALSISTSTKTIAEITIIDSLIGLSEKSGSISFDIAKVGDNLFASILGIGGGRLEMGKFGLNISPIPVPAPLILFGSGILALVVLRRKNS